MTRKQFVLDMAKRMGATVEYERHPSWGYTTVMVEAPAGHVWKADTSVHELVSSNDHAAEVWHEMAERMAYGVVPCTILHCEWCTEREPWKLKKNPTA